MNIRVGFDIFGMPQDNENPRQPILNTLYNPKYEEMGYPIHDPSTFEGA